MLYSHLSILACCESYFTFYIYSSQRTPRFGGTTERDLPFSCWCCAAPVRYGTSFSLPGTTSLWVLFPSVGSVSSPHNKTVSWPYILQLIIRKRPEEHNLIATNRKFGQYKSLRWLPLMWPDFLSCTSEAAGLCPQDECILHCTKMNIK